MSLANVVWIIVCYNEIAVLMGWVSNVDGFSSKFNEFKTVVISIFIFILLNFNAELGIDINVWINEASSIFYARWRWQSKIFIDKNILKSCSNGNIESILLVMKKHWKKYIFCYWNGFCRLIYIVVIYLDSWMYLC